MFWPWVLQKGDWQSSGWNGTRQAIIGWFISWKISTYKMDDDWGTPILGNHQIHIYIYMYIILYIYIYYIIYIIYILYILYFKCLALMVSKLVLSMFQVPCPKNGLLRSEFSGQSFWCLLVYRNSLKLLVSEWLSNFAAASFLNYDILWPYFCLFRLFADCQYYSHYMAIYIYSPWVLLQPNIIISFTTKLILQLVHKKCSFVNILQLSLFSNETPDELPWPTYVFAQGPATLCRSLRPGTPISRCWKSSPEIYQKYYRHTIINHYITTIINHYITTI